MAEEALEDRIKNSFYRLEQEQLTMVQRNAEELRLTSYLQELYETKDNNKIEQCVTRFQNYLDHFRRY